MNVSLMEMTIVLDGCTFTKKIGDFCIYSEEFGVYISDSEKCNTFQELIIYAGEWLEKQN